MLNIEKKQLLQWVEKIQGKRILIIGDLMVDEYWIGGVKRISPEAPVPIVNVVKRELRLGGAANVAFNVAALGAKPFLFGTVGDDTMGKRIIQLLQAKGMDERGVIVDSSRPTTRKTRILADNQHVTRVDHEDSSPISDKTADVIFNSIKNRIDEFDAVIFQDYNKGVLGKELIEKIIGISRAAGKIITVDPKYLNFFSYTGATLFKPNLKEVEEALGESLQLEADLEKQGIQLREKLGCDYLLITRGGEGMSLFSDTVFHVPTYAKKVREVSGAGDTVISTITCALSAGANYKEAAILANIAAGYVVGEVGIVPINKKILVERIENETEFFDR